jgi:pimeloyl-ACP methyl ester carboxylesterase
MVMGLGGSMDAWDPAFVDAIAAAGHKVVLFDNEGVGKSRLRKGTLSIRRMGDDLSALIRRMKLGRPDVVGWSMGGMLGQSFAVRHPAQLRRLALLATVPGDGKATPPSQAALDAVKAPGLGPLNVLFPEGSTQARDDYIAHILARTGAAPQAPPATQVKQFTASTNWIFGRDLDGHRISRLRLPVLVGGGELDQLLPFPNQQHIAKVIPGAKLVGYPDAAHGFFIQDAADFTPKLTAFLG